MASSGLGSVESRNGEYTQTAQTSLEIDIHNLVLSLASVNGVDYVRDIKKEVLDECEKATCESLIETIDQNFEEIDKLICRNLNDKNGHEEPRTGNIDMVEDELQQDLKMVAVTEKLDLQEVLNGIDKNEIKKKKDMLSENEDLNDSSENFADSTSGLETDPSCQGTESEVDKIDNNNGSNEDDSDAMDINNGYCFDEVDGSSSTEETLYSSVVSVTDCSDSVTADKDILKLFNLSQCYVQLNDIHVNSWDKTESIFSKKSIEEVDSVVCEMVERSDVPEGIVKYRKSSFKCTLCGQICKNENEAKQHGANFGCSAYNSAWQPKDKWRSHSKTRPFQCSMCKLCFTDKKSLRKHSLDVHGGEDRKFQCDICLKVFKQANHVKTHVEHVHLELRPFVCSVCGRSYKGRGSLTHHMRSHTGEHEICETCGRDFRDPSDLKKHIRNVHLKIKNFKCDICGHACSKQTDLSSHMNSHIDRSLKARNFQCQECDWRAVTAGQLRVHMKMHIKTLAYKCLHCAKQFKCEYYLERHKRHVHDRTGETFQCLQCPKSFTRKEYLNKHMKLHKFGRAFKCQTCGAAFVHFGSLKEHIKCRHEGKKRKGKTCAVCGKSVTHFKTHMMSHIKEKPFECARCGKRFLTEKRLKLHYRVHLDVKPYFCKGCDVGFARREYYCLHMIKFHDTKLSPKEADLRGKTENMKFSDSDDDDVGDSDN